MFGWLVTTGCTADGADVPADAPTLVADEATAEDEAPALPPVGGGLKAPDAEPVHFEIACDNAGSCCPPGTTAVLGTAGNDNYNTSALTRCYLGLGGDDTVTNTSASGRNVAYGGPGSDWLQGGHGPGILYGGDGPDYVYGRASADFLRGGNGDDSMSAKDGDDILDGNANDDIMWGDNGNDVLIGGSGQDFVFGGNNDDIVIVNDVCELVAGEEMQGGSGTDTLVLPVPLATVTGMGITVAGFEKVIVLGEDQHFDCGVSCNCPPVLVPEMNNLCDYSAAMIDPDDAQILEDICLDAIDDIGPQIVAALPVDPDASDVAAYIADFHVSHPTIIPNGLTLSLAGEVNPDPMPALQPPGAPQPGVIINDMTPCDYPNFPAIDVGIGEDGTADNCSPAEEAIIAADLERAKFYVWRSLQALEEVNDAVVANDLVTAELLWNQGLDELSLAWWFGEFDEGRLAAVTMMFESVWSTLHGDYATNTKINVQCWKPLRPWEMFWFSIFNPPGFLAKMVANPCAWGTAGAHTVYTIEPGITMLGLLYPVYSLEVCQEYFWNTSAVWRATTMVHEFLHHKSNAYGLVRDRHPSTGSDCSGPCYDASEAHNLALNHPDHAVINNSNYHWYAGTIGEAYNSGRCDTGPNNALCRPSVCCGNGKTDSEAGEVCDGNNFGGVGTVPGVTCMDFGWSEGELQCEDQCTTINPERCHGECGNGVIDPANALEEQCDGWDFGGASCATYGFTSGSLSCTTACTISTAGCSGGTTYSPPASYLSDCSVDAATDCNGDPEGCHLAPDAGYCAGGPCLRTDPGGNNMDPTSDFHPKGNFKDALGNLHYCEEILGRDTTCVDVNGWGVCKLCGDGPGETLLGCPCNDNVNDCGLDLVCWGADFPNGGFCWPAGGPPDFQCEQGACGQSIRDGQGDAIDGEGYCEHYTLSGEARCMPERCGSVQALQCAASNAVCGPTPDQFDCIPECAQDEDCEFSGWPDDYQCDDGRCVL